MMPAIKVLKERNLADPGNYLEIAIKYKWFVCVDQAVKIEGIIREVLDAV